VLLAAAVTYTLTSSLPGTDCPSKTDVLSITVKSTPSVVTTPDTTVCGNTPFSLYASVSPAGNQYSYHWSGPGTFSSDHPVAAVNNNAGNSEGNYVVTVVNDTNGCYGSAATLVGVTTPDTPVVASPVVLCLNKAAEPIVAIGRDITWYSAEQLPLPSPPVPPSDREGLFRYYVSDRADNCESPRKEIDVAVKRCCDGTIFIPTAFTPNGDGLNDVFRPLEDYGYFIYSMTIFNRWGQIAYSGGTYSAWDGRSNGSAADAGTYFYFIKFGCILGGSLERSGDVTLIR
jgi:gliding motility-associated-like protein